MKTFGAPWRFSGIAGLLFVAISLLASGINILPPSHVQEEAAFVSWHAEHARWFRFGHVLAGFAFVLFYFPFYAGFCEKLREVEGHPAVWTRVTWAGAIMSPAAGTVAGSFVMGMAVLGVQSAVDVWEFAMAANFYAFVVSGAFAGVALVGAAAVMLRAATFARWLGWAALVIGIAAIGSIGALVESDPEGLLAGVSGLAWLLYFLWIAAVSIDLIRTPRKSARGAGTLLGRGL